VNRSIVFFFCLSIRSNTHVECPISIHCCTNTNNKVNKTALRSSLIISFNIIFFILILSILNQFLFSSYYYNKKKEQITYHYIYIYIYYSYHSSFKCSSSSTRDTLARIGTFLNVQFILFPLIQCMISHMILREKKNLIQPQETYTGSKVTYCLLCHYGQKGKMIASSSLFNSE